MAPRQAAPGHDAAPSPVPEIPLASRPRDPALYAFRQSERREIQMEMAQMRAKREFLNSRSAELDVRESRIEMLYRTMSRESNTAFGTPGAPQASQALLGPQAPLAPQVSEAPQAPPGLVLHFMDIDQDRDFRTPDCPAPADPILGSLTPGVPPRPTYRADPQTARGNGLDPDPSQPSSSDDEAGRRNPIASRAAFPDKKREIAQYKVESTELKLGGWPSTIQFAVGDALCVPQWPAHRIVPSLRLLGSSRSRVLTRRSTRSVRTRRTGLGPWMPSWLRLWVAWSRARHRGESRTLRRRRPSRARSRVPA